MFAWLEDLYGHTYFRHASRFLFMIISFFLTGPISAQVQDRTAALDYFNRASKEYIKKDKLSALRTLDEGLRNYPGDARMLKLAEELLKESQQQQQQDQQKKEDQDQQDKKEQEQKDKGEQKEQEKKGEEEKRSGQQPQSRDQEEPAEQAQRKPGTIAPEDARRMLDALDRQERKVQDKVREHQRPASRIPIEKDW